ncbi:MAG: TrkH family potassium uptake protein [Paludibacteraceae bacterium]|nr:TrkH family potassium uptake protein [Paludibacteraceae bacterium]
MNRLSIKIVWRTMCILLQFEAVFMFLSAIVSFVYNEPEFIHLIISTGVTFLFGIIGILFTRDVKNLQMGKREGYMVVSLIWIVFSFFGLLPFYLSGHIPDFTDAFFETMSGFTTTGATILTDIESMPHGLLFWRSLTQWLGGMGIIVLSMAILPIIGAGGMSMFTAEVPGPTKDKLHAKLDYTAKILWSIYAAITLIESVILWLCGMDYFDAICHSFTTMASGGFSTKAASIAYWHSPLIEYIIIVFMIMSGINFTLYYHMLRGRFKKLTHNEELKAYLIIILVMTTLVMGSLLIHHNNIMGTEKAFRYALFNVTALITTTGFANSDYTTWAPFVWTVLLMMMAFGACAGSTSGGIKTVRITLLLKNSYYEFKRLIHPNAVIPVRFNEKVVKPQLIDNVQAFVFLYLIVVIVSVLFFTACGLDFDNAVGTSISAVSNVGPAIDQYGPMANYAPMPPLCKWYMCLLMMAGRLELFTVFMIFTPSFWKK